MLQIEDILQPQQIHKLINFQIKRCYYPDLERRLVNKWENLNRGLIAPKRGRSIDKRLSQAQVRKRVRIYKWVWVLWSEYFLRNTNCIYRINMGYVSMFLLE